MEHSHKGYIVFRDKVYCHWHIRHDGKGGVPNCLDSSYTKLGLALAAIDRYREEVPLEAPVKAPKANAQAA
jgi:hypothetical protein